MDRAAELGRAGAVDARTTVGIPAIVRPEVVRPREKHGLRRRIGGDFDRYCTQVRCWIPRPDARAAGHDR